MVSASASAIRLNRSAHVPNSSSEVTGTRADRSPCSIGSAARLAASTGARTPAGDGPRDEESDEDQRDRADGQGRPELAERLVDRGHVVDEVERGPAAADPAADDEARPAGDRRPRIGELAGVDALREVGRERGLGADEVGPRDDRLAGADVDDRVDAALQERLAEAAVDDVVAGRLGGQAAVRDGLRQVEPRLGRGVAQDLVVKARLDEDVGAGAEQDRGQRDQRDERDRQACPDAAESSPRASADRLVAGASDRDDEGRGRRDRARPWTRRRPTATSTSRESPR